MEEATCTSICFEQVINHSLQRLVAAARFNEERIALPWLDRQGRLDSEPLRLQRVGAAQARDLGLGAADPMVALRYE